MWRQEHTSRPHVEYMLQSERDLKVVIVETVRQHWLVVCWITLVVKMRKIAKVKPRIKLWKLKKGDYCEVAVGNYYSID